MRIKAFLFLKVMWLTLLLAVQSGISLRAQSITDTIFQIKAVVIKASRSQHFRNDIKTDVFTTKDLKPFTGESLGRFFMNNSAINIKTYSVGGALANVSLHGTSASNVQINWNGFPINSVTLGSCDLSMVPVVGFDQVSIVYGAPGALYGSGTFGGAINLNNTLKPEKALTGSADVSYESLQTITGSTSFLIGNNKLAWKINAWGNLSENEFLYYDYIRQSERKQTDGGWHDAGILQQAIVKLSESSTLEAGLWYQVKDYNIPSRIGSISFENQKDSTLKLYIAYKKSNSLWGLQVKSAVFKDEQSYFQKPSAQSLVYSIESHINALQYYGDADFRYLIRPFLSLDAGIRGNYITAEVSSYGGEKRENGLSAFTGLKYDNSRLSLQTEIRKEWNTNFSSGVLPSFGLAWKIAPDKWTIRANISEKFRKPTFNDLFWTPGGNPDLKPENGFSIEVGSVVNILEKENIKLSTDINVYWLEINDMIVWQPAGAYWMAYNYQHVRSQGIDASLKFDWESGIIKYHSALNVTLNHSKINTYKGQEQEKMLYSPRIISSWENRFSAGVFDFTVWHHFTADRFYDDDSLLEPYQTVDTRVGVKLPVWKGKLGIHITVNNLTNTTYELIRLYPMPGRYWSVKMSYEF
jgi:vitamin B12 transporter